MASPQLEDGRLEVANELAEAFAKLYLSSRESRVLWAILRKTYGWHKKADRISFTQFEVITGMNRRHVADAIKSLTHRQIITRTGNNYKLEYGLQKDYTKWNLLPIMATNKVKHLQSLPIVATKQIVTHSGNTPLPIVATKSLPIVANTKAKSIYTKAIDDVRNQSFEDYKQALRARYSDLDFDLELEKFHLYWGDNGRRPKNPKIALLNWLDKARRIKGGKDNGTSQHTNRRVPKPEEYKQPHEY